MPILPLDNYEPFAITLGTMLYPGIDESRNAQSFAARYLEAANQELYSSSGRLNHETPRRLTVVRRKAQRELNKRWRTGTVTGEITKCIYALSEQAPELASWKNGASIAERVAARERVSGSRSALYEARKTHRSMAHYWCAWVLREGKFSSVDPLSDFYRFLLEAEWFRRWGQSWRSDRSKAVPLFPDNLWELPESWLNRLGESEDRLRIKIPILHLPNDLIESFRPAGRPKSA